MTPASISQMLIASFKKAGATDNIIRNKSNDKMNGCNAYEAENYCTIKDKNSLIYHLILFSGSKVVIFQGIAFNDLQTNLADFKKMAHTLRFKS